jgi:hypothetical protein
MIPDSHHYFTFLRDEIARARAERDLAVATMVLDSVERFLRSVARAIADATRTHA